MDSAQSPLAGTPRLTYETAMDLLALADFDLVATHGGYGRASRKTGRPKATLSRRIIELEDSLGVRLIERGAQPSHLTEAGALLHARIQPLFEELAEATALVGDTRERPQGHLRVSAPALLSDMVLGRIAAGFAQAYPEVQLDITSEDRLADPSADGYDVVIRVNPSPDEHLVGRCVLRDERWLVAVPGFPRPMDGVDGDPPRLPVVVRTMVRHGTTWKIRHGGADLRFAPAPVMRLSSYPMLRDAVLAGAGAALLPRSLVGHDVAVGRLLHWGVEDAPTTELWALHTSRRLASPKVAAFIRHLVSALGSNDVQGVTLLPRSDGDRRDR